MTIIKIEPLEDGLHPIESQSHRYEVWMDGYIEVPTELDDAVWATRGYCDLTIDEGRLIGVTQLPIPSSGPAEPDMDELTMTQLAVAELAQTVESNNTAAQLAIAELSEAILGGDTNGKTVL